MKKALDSDTLLAYEMNGRALPEKHGFPLRAVVPGWAADSWTKWVSSIRVLDKGFDGYWMKNAYRHPGKAVTPGSAVALEAMRPVQSLRVKSVIASPADGAQVEAGKPAVIRGAAWSGVSGPVTSVEVSVDNGRSWQQARLSGDATRFGWRLWDSAWTPASEGYYTLLARARDAGGDSQPLGQEWNPSGYLWNVVARAGVEVAKDLRGPAPHSGPAVNSVPPPPQFAKTCLRCHDEDLMRQHDEDLMRQQHLTRAQWDREINKMAGWTPVDEDTRVGILNYLAGNYGR